MANPTPNSAPPPGRAPVIRSSPLEGRPNLTQNLLHALPAWIISVAIHAVLLTGFFFLVTNVMATDDSLKDKKQIDVITSAVEVPQKEPDLTNTEIGLDDTLETNYNVDRKDDVSVPGPVDPTAAVGISGAPEGPPMTIPPPPGSGRGQGAAISMPDQFGTGSIGLTVMGGYGNIKAVPGGFAGRSGATREKMAMEGGGNKASEASVASGLLWLALHQAEDGHWSLGEFNKHNRDKLEDVKRKTVNATGMAQETGNDVAGTAFGLLPFLAAGKTHRPTGNKKEDIYLKTVDSAIKFLRAHQGAKGDFAFGKSSHHQMYTHGLATIAMCEAYGLTSDPILKRHAQAAINFIEDSQDPKSGGWRYTPKSGGDTSVVGWQLMALKSGQMAGLNVKTKTLDDAKRWLDSCETKSANNYGYGYTGPSPTPTMTAVGLLCRQYMGTPPRNPGLLEGVKVLKKNPPGGPHGIYYDYYATQVMHHMGGDSWDFWNYGPNKNDGIRDILIKRQDRGVGNRPHQKGSWDPSNDQWGRQGGRIMQTSLCLLTLEVYYRHLPLYRRDSTMMK